ncbi:MAG: hypothetical protein U9N87_06250 [Planctomycetota bacterium]|nr:hypothetical protein [Planctomycetota bacterium]
MHVVDALEDSLRLAKQIGYRIRQEWLGGSGGGGCEIRGQKCLFLDLSLGPDEQLDQVLDTLKHDLALADVEVPPNLRPLLPDATVSAQLVPNPSLASGESTSSKPGTAAATLRQFTTQGRSEQRKTA